LKRVHLDIASLGERLQGRQHPVGCQRIRSGIVQSKIKHPRLLHGCQPVNFPGKIGQVDQLVGNQDHQASYFAGFHHLHVNIFLVYRYHRRTPITNP
jgi:hypothetical protein